MGRRDFMIEKAFTKAYQDNYDRHVAIREAMCLDAQYPGVLGQIEDGDLIAGRINPALIGFTPDEWGQTAFGYYLLSDEMAKELAREDLSDAERLELEEMVKFWKTENTSFKVRSAYSEELQRNLPSDDWMNEAGMVFPLYRMCGAYIDYKKLVTLGIPGLQEEIKAAQKQAKETGNDHELFEGMLIALEVLSKSCLHYANEAKTLAVEANSARKEELLKIAEILENLPRKKPTTFRAALQLMWLYSIISDVRNYGRMDVYMGDFLADDLATGEITEVEALSLLQSLWQLMADRNTRVHGRVIVGGVGRPNEENADKFAMLAMEASRTVLEIEPQLSLRFYDGMNPELMDKALDVVGEGRTFPILYNDDVNVPAVQAAFQIGEEEAKQYVPFGCGEYIIDHKSFGTPSGVINLLKILEIVLHGGVDPTTGKVVGPENGDLTSFSTFEELLSAYKKQVEYLVSIMARQEAIEYEVMGQESSNLYLSMLYDDCIARGEGIFSGGIKYLGGTLETYGNVNTADSLSAIKKLVFDEEKISAKELLAALRADFVGYENIQKELLAAPKYGNDIAVADKMMQDIHNHVCHAVKEQNNAVGLHSYLVVVINNSANTLMGTWTGASADGRKSGKSMANGNNPTSGQDTKGVTAMLNSLIKLDPTIHAGAVQNMKFSRDLFTKKREELEALLETYFAEGGTQAMITVVNRGDLEKAIEEPENYKHLFVRVGGFSARFVDLGRDVQMEILSRTLY